MIPELFSCFRLPWRLHRSHPAGPFPSSRHATRLHLNCSLAAASCPKGKQARQRLLGTRPLKVGKLNTHRLSISGLERLKIHVSDPAVNKSGSPSDGDFPVLPIKPLFFSDTLHPSLLPSFCQRDIPGERK